MGITWSVEILCSVTRYEAVTIPWVSVVTEITSFAKCSCVREKKKLMHQSEVVSLPSLETNRDLVYPGRNRDVREILRNLIGCLEDWKLKDYQITENQNPGLVY